MPADAVVSALAECGVMLNDMNRLFPTFEEALLESKKPQWVLGEIVTLLEHLLADAAYVMDHWEGLS